jgi:hypothetical protein
MRMGKRALVLFNIINIIDRVIAAYRGLSSSGTESPDKEIGTLTLTIGTLIVNVLSAFSHRH